MRLNRSNLCRRSVVLLVTLALLAFGVGQQQVMANHELIMIAVAVAAGAGVLVTWLILRNGDPDPSNPSLQSSRSGPWRPLPEIAKGAFEKQFGRSVQFPGSSAFTHATYDDPASLGEDLRGSTRQIHEDSTRAWIANEELTRLVPID